MIKNKNQWCLFYPGSLGRAYFLFETKKEALKLIEKWAYDEGFDETTELILFKMPKSRETIKIKTSPNKNYYPYFDVKLILKKYRAYK